MVKGRVLDVTAPGLFATLTSCVDEVCSSVAGTVTVIDVALIVTGVNTFAPKFTVAPVAKLLPVIVRSVRAALPVNAMGGDNRDTIGAAGGGGGGVGTVKNTFPVMAPAVAVI